MFKIAILQKRAINAQIDKNIESIIAVRREASENHADILLLPECFITGYDLPMSYEKSIEDNDIRIAKICENAIKYNEPINVSTKNGNAIVLSEEDYNSLMETIYISSIPKLKEFTPKIESIITGLYCVHAREDPLITKS